MRTLTEKVIKPHLPRTAMSRAERRQLKRDDSKKPKRYTLTQAQIDKIKDDATMDATKRAFLMMLGFPLLALHDEFGFGKQRLNRFMEKMLDIYAAYEEDYIDLTDLHEVIMQETGVTIEENRKGKA